MCRSAIHFWVDERGRSCRCPILCDQGRLDLPLSAFHSQPQLAGSQRGSHSAQSPSPAYEAALFIPFAIAGDSRYRRKFLKLCNIGSLVDITGVDNMIHLTKILHDRRIEEAMGVGEAPAGCGESASQTASYRAPTAARTFAQSNVKGSTLSFGMAASSALNRSALALLIG